MKLGYLQPSNNQSDNKDNWVEFIDFLSRLKSGDSVIINSLFDFCCSVKDLFRFYSLSKQYGVIICSSHKNESWFDTSNDKVGVEILERFCFECITRTTKRGIEQARRRGTQMGRKAGSSTIDQISLESAYKEYYYQKATMKDSCSRHSISESTLYRYMRKNSLPNRLQ